MGIIDNQRTDDADRAWFNRSPYSLFSSNPDRLDWYRRNNYPPSAFGVGYGFHEKYGTFKGSGYNRHYSAARVGCYPTTRFGYRQGWDSRNCYRAPRYIGDCYDSYVIPGYVSYPGVLPYYTSSTYIQSSPLYSIPLAEAVQAPYEQVEIPAGITTLPDQQALDDQAPAVADVSKEGAVSDTALAHQVAGEQAFQNGQYEQARREFVQAMLAAPEDPEALMLYGYAHFATGDYLVATLSIRRALAGDPTLIDSPIDLQELYGDSNEFLAHVEALSSFMNQHPEVDDAKFLSGYVAYAAGNPRQAADVFATAVERDTQDVMVRLLRDAAIRADVYMAEMRARQGEPQSDQTATDEQPTPESPTSDPAEIEPTPESF